MLYIPLPTADARAQIVTTLARNKPVAPNVDVQSIGRECEGFSGADLGALVKEAATIALKVSQLANVLKNY